MKAKRVRKKHFAPRVSRSHQCLRGALMCRWAERKTGRRIENRLAALIYASTSGPKFKTAPVYVTTSDRTLLRRACANASRRASYRLGTAVTYEAKVVLPEKKPLGLG